MAPSPTRVVIASRESAAAPAGLRESAALCVASLAAETGRLASERLRRLVTERSRADQTGVTLESVPHEEAAPPGAAEVTGRVEQAARHLAERQDVGDRDFRRALDLWLPTTDRAARRLDDNPDAPLPPDEVYALEAVVRADGTRPSLLVRNGVVDPVQPLAAGWTGSSPPGSADVRRYRIVEATPSEVNGTKFARLDAAVLRIEPLPDGPQDVPDALTVSAAARSPATNGGGCSATTPPR
jgi:hypothetical protein